MTFVVILRERNSSVIISSAVSGSKRANSCSNVNLRVIAVYHVGICLGYIISVDYLWTSFIIQFRYWILGKLECFLSCVMINVGYASTLKDKAKQLPLCGFRITFIDVNEFSLCKEEGLVD